MPRQVGSIALYGVALSVQSGRVVFYPWLVVPRTQACWHAMVGDTDSVGSLNVLNVGCLRFT